MVTTVKKVMTTKLITIESGASLLKAGLLMKENRIRHLPVVDSDQNIIGVLSQRDLTVISNADSIPVDWVMNSPVEDVGENLSLKKTIYKMLQMKISSLLVTTNDDEVVGIVTTDDLLWHLATLLQDDRNEKTQLDLALGIQTIGKVANQLSDMGI